MNDKKTAVEWLRKEINKLTGLNIAIDEPCIIQAKEIEMQQMIDAYESLEHRHGQNYYNATYKTNQDEPI
jgi:hypothetical protein